ncbi:hypothetical protein BAA08_02300 [Bizionia sp. APA-3]|nr:hypothetical protein BAA08_02300 [Bizionia sp. APA-3]
MHVENISSELLKNENRFDLDNKIYTLNREVLYSFSKYEKETLIPSDIKYIRLTVIGTTKPFSKFDSDYSQTVIEYEYLNAAKKILATEKTGLIENDKNIWFHPPRTLDAGILQLSAFPYIKLTDQTKWKWKLDAAFEKYQDVHLVHSYKKMKSISYKTKFGLLPCIPISATSQSHIGISTSVFIYNEKYGFVKLEFNNIDGTTIVLEMI